ncbi:unnamed protein product [Closterium sp. NIES-54]
MATGCKGADMVEDVASVVLGAVQRRTTTPVSDKEVPVGDALQNLDVGASRVGAQLHPLDYWVLDTGAAWTMTPLKDLLDDVRAAPINKVCSASGHALKVAGAGRSAFKGVDGKPVVLHDVLLVPDLKANLISLRKLAKAGVSTSTDGARTYKGQLGNQVLWDLHESKDVYRSMWQLPALAWHGGGQAGEGSASQGECNAVGGVGVKVSSGSRGTDWAMAHRRLGHVAMPLLKQVEKDGVIKGLKLNGQPLDDNCEICLLSKFSRFPFHSVTGRSKKPLELVHMDLVGPLPVQGLKGERYFLTIVDDWSRLMWAYLLKQKDHATFTIREDWLPFVEKQAESVVKRIRTERSAEQVNRTILETARALLIESGVGNSICPHAVRHATEARNRVLTKVGDDSWVPLERWLGRKPPVDMLRVFGCMAVAHVSKMYRSTFGASAIWCVLLGLAVERKGCLLWEPSKGVLFDSRDVKFVEGMMYGSWEKQPKARVTLHMEQITMSHDLTSSVWEEGEEAAAQRVAHVPKKYRSKLGASAIWCVHLGLAAESKGWLLWEPSKGVLFDSRDVKFVEGMMYGGWKKQPETKVSQQMEQITMQLDLTPSVWEEGEEAAAEGGDGEKVQEAPAGGGDDVETSGSTKEAAGSEGGEQQQGKAKLTAGADVAEQQLGNEEALLILPHGYDPDEEVGDDSWVPLERKGCLLWEPSKGVLFDSRDVKFVEGMMYGSWEKQPKARVTLHMEQITMSHDLTSSVWEEGEEAAAQRGDGEKVQEALARGGGGVEASGRTSGAVGHEGEQQQGKTKLTAGADVAEQQLGNDEALLILPHGYDPDEEDEPAYCYLAPAPEEPASMEEALPGPDWEKWLVSRDAE